jgi:hypothetical protein
MSNFTEAFPGARIAGRMADAADFREGWAKVPFVGNKPHWYEEVTEIARVVYPDAPADTRWFSSLCGVWAVTNERNGLLNPGNFPLCKTCLKKAPRWATREERDTTVPDDVLTALQSGKA